MTAQQLPQCRHRGDEIAAGRWICDSSKLVARAQVVTADICQSVCPYVDHSPEHALTQLRLANTDEPHPEMPLDTFIETIRAGSDDFPWGWQRWEVAQRAHRQMLDLVAADRGDYPGSHDGRGIVIGAGGPTYFACAYVCVSLLRAHGCELPVEFWYLGEEELDEQMAAIVQPLGVTCHNAHEVIPRPRVLQGWELKPFSIIHSRFREVLYLDADNLPVLDPTYLFEEREYRERGSIFWPDFPSSGSVDIVTWDVAGIASRSGPAFESGQVLIDKSRCWHELAVTMHLNEHSDFWYRYVYGDKDTFKLAWHKTDRAYAMTTKLPSWKWPAALQYDFAGELVFFHACHGKQQIRAGTRIPDFPHSDLAQRAAQTLQRAWRPAWPPGRPTTKFTAGSTTKPFVRIPIGAVNMWVRNGPPRSWDIAITNSVMNQDEYSLRDIVEAGDGERVLTIVDVGANIGAFTLAARRAFPLAQLIAVEADPENAELLRRNCSDDPFVTVCESAVLDDDCEPTADLCQHDRNRGSNYLPSVFQQQGLEAPFVDALVTQVNCLPLHALLTELDVAEIDLLKVDAEGSEVPIFANLARHGWLEKTRWIRFEWHDRATIPRLWELLAPTHEVSIDERGVWNALGKAQRRSQGCR